MQKRQFLQQVVLGKQDSACESKKLEHSLNTLHKNKLQMA